MNVSNSTDGDVTNDAVSTQPDALQITHLVFLILVGLVGTTGNVMTIIAVRIERKLRESLSNLFVVNLAIADLVVCATVVPMLLAHDAKAETLFGPALCYVTVTISGIACHTAAATMTCIALTRYIAASSATKYHSIVTRKRVYLSIAGVWLFAVVNTVPILLAWIETGYDVTKYVCVCFDGTFPLYYILGAIFIGHFLPHGITIFCYISIVRAMRKSRRRFSSATSTSMETTGTSNEKSRRRSGYITSSENESESSKPSSGLSVRNWSKHEIQLLKTSIWVIAFFSFCWIPYGVLVLLQDLAPIQLKKTFASLCLLSFSVNPIIYGFLSKSFRRAYHRIVHKIFCECCGRVDSFQIKSSTSGIDGSSKMKQDNLDAVSSHQKEKSFPQTEKEYGRSAPL